MGTICYVVAELAILILRKQPAERLVPTDGGVQMKIHGKGKMVDVPSSLFHALAAAKVRSAAAGPHVDPGRSWSGMIPFSCGLGISLALVHSGASLRDRFGIEFCRGIPRRLRN